MTAKNGLDLIPPGCEDVARIAAPVCAAIGGVSVSSFLKNVREGRAPQPVVRAPRCTRWLLADVKEYWRKSAEPSEHCATAAAVVQSRAKKASAAAASKRVRADAVSPTQGSHL